VRVKKQRIDILLVQRGLAPSRQLAQRLVMAGEVLVDGQPVTKPGTRVATSADIHVRERPRFVGRGGEKLDAALQAFDVRPESWVCADVGASTGGFTDCLLQAGAARVYAIDVGYGQLAWSLRNDRRVVVMERTNARYVDRLPEPVALVAADVSFISLRLLLPVFVGWMQPEAQAILLVKPQFEAGKRDVGKGGVVRDPDVHRRVLLEVTGAARQIGFAVCGLTPSPLLGPAGNREFLLWLRLAPPSESVDDVDALIETCLSRSS
jgi:23S rRNA (cytidine1920-2'-O)/16S rRNA (cytidine1409-2'-O)-methyltransferase